MVPSACRVCEPYKECPEIKTPMTECTNSNRNNQATLFPWDKVGLTFGFCMLISCLISFDLIGGEGRTWTKQPNRFQKLHEKLNK